MTSSTNFEYTNFNADTGSYDFEFLSAGESAFLNPTTYPYTLTFTLSCALDRNPDADPVTITQNIEIRDDCENQQMNAIDDVYIPIDIYQHLWEGSNGSETVVSLPHPTFLINRCMSDSTTYLIHDYDQFSLSLDEPAMLAVPRITYSGFDFTINMHSEGAQSTRETLKNLVDIE